MRQSQVSAPSVVRTEKAGVTAEVEEPTLVVADAVADRFPARPVPVEVAVFQCEAGAVRGLGGEDHLDLADVLRVGFDLPGRADVPAEHHTVRWVIGEDPSPPAHGTVGASRTHTARWRTGWDWCLDRDIVVFVQGSR